MEALRTFVRAVARRLGTQALFDAGAACLCIGFGVASLVVLAERLLSLGADVGLFVALPLVVASMAGLVAGLARWPGLPAAALRADERLGLEERVSSALAVGSEPMACLVREDAARRIEGIGLAQAIPIRAPRLLVPLGLSAIGLVVALLVPAADLLGWGAARRARAEDAAAVREATNTALAKLGRQAAAAREQGLGRSAKALKEIEEAMAALAASDASTAEAQKTARQALGEVERTRGSIEEAQRAAADPGRIEKAKQELDILQSSSSVLEQWKRDLAGETPGGVRPRGDTGYPGKKDDGGASSRAAEFVRSSDLPPTPLEAATVESKLLAAKPAAVSAMQRNDIPWRYRRVVRRYFSPAEEETR